MRTLSFLFILLVAITFGCKNQVPRNSYDTKIESKYGFVVSLGSGWGSDTVSLSINGEKILGNVIFPSPKSYEESNPFTDPITSVVIKYDKERLFVSLFGIEQPPYQMEEKEKLEIQVTCGSRQSHFSVDLNKGRFIEIEDFLYYGNINVKTHILVEKSRSRLISRKEEVDYSIENEIVRLLQSKRPFIKM